VLSEGDDGLVKDLEVRLAALDPDAAAAAALLVHHSTLQERIAHADRLLGWPVREPHGRHRLYLALALRRLRRYP
jgi:sugar diacid utilization regulator